MKEKNTVVGVLSYITILGFIVALIIHLNQKDSDKKFGAFHLRQALGLGVLQFLVSLALNLILPIFKIDTNPNLLSFAVFVFAIIGILNAAKGELKELPLIGKFISEKLGSTFE